MGIQTLSVAVQTKSGDYVLSVTEQKVASHTYRVGLRPEGTPKVARRGIGLCHQRWVGS